MTLPLKVVESRKNWNGQHQVKWPDIYKLYIQLCWPAGPQGMDDNEQDPVEECHGSVRDTCPQGRPRVARPAKARTKNIGRKECRESRRKHVDQSDGSGREY